MEQAEWEEPVFPVSFRAIALLRKKNSWGLLCLPLLLVDGRIESKYSATIDSPGIERGFAFAFAWVYLGLPSTFSTATRT